MFYGTTPPEFGKLILVDAQGNEQSINLNRIENLPETVKLLPQRRYLLLDEETTYRGDGQIIIDDDIIVLLQASNIIIDDDIIVLSLHQPAETEEVNTLYPLCKGMGMNLEDISKDDQGNSFINIIEEKLSDEPHLRFGLENAYVFIDDTRITIFGPRIGEDTREMGLWEYKLDDLKAIYKTGTLNELPSGQSIIGKELWLYKK